MDTYKVTFDAGRGLIRGTNTKFYTVEIPMGKSLRETISVPASERDKWRFVTWITNSGDVCDIEYAYDEDMYFNAKYTTDMLWDHVPIAYDKEFHAGRAYIFTNGQWVPVSPRTYTNMLWQRSACPADFTDYAQAELPVQAFDIYYTGMSIQPVWSDFDPDGVILTGRLEATDAGTYEVTAILQDGYKWSDDTVKDKTLYWTILPAFIPQDALPVQINELTYDGNNQSPEFQYDDTYMYMEDPDVCAINAGDYTATFVALPNYQFPEVVNA